MNLKEKNVKFETKPAPRCGNYPLSFQQRTIWLDSQLYPSSSKWNLSQKKIIDGILDVKSLEIAINKLIKRHAILRTIFKHIDGEARQYILDSHKFNIEIKDFTSINDQVKQSQLVQAYIKENELKLFQLDQFSLFRISVVKVSNTKSIYLLVIHHILVDASSLTIFSKELDYYYKGITNKNLEELPELKFQYFDYAYWQDKTWNADFLKEKKNYWMDSFMKEKFSQVDLPVDFKKPLLPSFRGKSIIMSLDDKFTGNLVSFSIRNRVQLFTTLLSAFSILLNKYCMQNEIVIGSSMVGRDKYGEISKIIGYFLNTVIYKFNINSSKSYKDYLKTVQKQVVLTFKNQEYPFDILIQDLRNAKIINNNQIFNVFIDYIPSSNYILFPKNKELTTSYSDKIFIDNETNISLYDIQLYVYQSDKHLSFRLEYSSDLFKDSTILRMMKGFGTLLQHIISSDGNCTINKLQIINRDEQNELLSKLKGNYKHIDKAVLFTHKFERQVKKTPHQIAVKCGQKFLTYEELNKKSNRIAAYLIKNKNHFNQSIIAVYLEKNIHVLTSLIGILKAGCVYLPIDTEYPEGRVKFILNNSKAEFIIADSNNIEKAKSYVKGNGSLPHILCIDEALKETTFLENYSENNPQMEIQPDDLAYIIYTSGSTGNPKGAKIHHLGMLNHLHAKINDLEINENDIIAQTASIGFDISVWQFLAGLMIGARVVIVSKKDILNPNEFITIIKAERISVLETVPSILKILAGPGTLNSSLRWMISTGEPISGSLVKEWYSNHKIKLLNAYGPTEASDDITHYIIPSDISDNIIPIGIPIQNTRIYILDSDLNVCPIGVKGEICVSGLGVGKGYLNDEANTHNRFVPNPFIDLIEEQDHKIIYKTGDIGYYREDGVIICLGRLDNQVKIAGNRIELDEIQNTLLSHKQIENAVVTVRKDSENGENIICGYFISADLLDTKDIKEYLAEFLPRYMIPSYIIQINSIPLTQNGKIDFNALPAPQIKVENDIVLARNEIEQKLSAIWSKILNINKDRIGINTNFFDVGGNSLKVIQLVLNIHKEFDIQIDLRYFFENPTIEHLFEMIDVIRWISIDSENNSTSLGKEEIVI